MTHTKDEALKLALEALQIVDNVALIGSAYTLKSVEEGLAKVRASMLTIKQALAAPTVQELVAWRYTDARGHYRYRGYVPGFDSEYQLLKPEALCLATPPAQPAPVPLTYEQITAISKQVAEGGPEDSIDRFVRAIEAAHGITKGGAA